MKIIKILMILALISGPIRPAMAIETEWTYRNAVTFVVPGKTFSAVALYDFVGQESLIGGETDIVRFPKVPDLALTVGAVGDFSGSADSELNRDDRSYLNGTAFVGAKYNVEKLNIKDLVHFGVFYGRNLKKGKNLFGIKSSVKFW